MRIVIFFLLSYSCLGQTNCQPSEIIYFMVKDGIKIPTLGIYPLINSNNDTLIFIFNNFYFRTVRLSKNEWQLPEKMMKAESGDGRISMSNDFIYQEKVVKWIGNRPIYDIFYRKIADIAYKPVFSSISNSYNSSRYSPTVSTDDKTLYFTNIDTNGFAKIFVSQNVNNQWQTPQALPSPININNYDSESPTLLADNKTLIFISNRPQNKGVSDFYITKIENGKWSEPILLTCLPLKRTQGTCSMPIDQSTIYFYKKQNYQYDSRIDTINTDNEYLQMYQHIAKMTKNGVVKPEQFGDVISSINMKERPKPLHILNTDLLFDINSYQLKSHLTLDKFLSQLEVRKVKKIIIEAHTDNIGTTKTNIVLSEKRAIAVVTYFQQKGIPTQIMESKGYGETMPLVPNTNETNRVKNRRVEIKIIY